MTFLAELRLLCEKHGVKLISGIDQDSNRVVSKIVAQKMNPDGTCAAQYEIPDILPPNPKPEEKPERLRL